MTQGLKKNQFGTLPVFLTAISTILGAVMFLRFGYAVGNVGFLGTLAIIAIGHAVTIPTAMALAEIATNQKVEGGGEYFIISRSFGLVTGSAIGVALYLSQAISVAFYIIAFAEAFNSLSEYLLNTYELHSTVEFLLKQKQTVSVPALFGLTAIVLTKGADLGVKALYVVVATLTLSLIFFFIGKTDYSAAVDFQLTAKVADPDNFFMVFAIIFPAFTGMTAGVGLSGDLKKPSRSIPLGTLAGTVSGMIIYVFIAYKLSSSAPPEALDDISKLVMADIAFQGWWIIPLGLAAATISSALGSLMVAPRTLQAIARDKILPNEGMNNWLAKGAFGKDEPFNGTIATIGIAFIFVMIGEIDMVAEVISMFFMVTYGSLCLISFLQHFAADPSYRPTFKSRWYLSLLGAVACFGLMFFMNALYAVIALVMMTLLYVIISYYNQDKKNLALIFQGVIFQLSRQLQVFLQKAEKEQTANWRPAVVAISENSFTRFAAFDLLRWISQKYGFGTYIHTIEGYLSKDQNQAAEHAKKRLIRMAEASKSNIYIDTLVSPSYTSTIAQVIQLPGISGKENNLLMFEYSKNKPTTLSKIIDNFKLVKSVDFDVIILGSSERGFGFKREIHIWIDSKDYGDANLMILLAYILIGHKEWAGAFIKIFAIYPEETINEERQRIYNLIESGRLPITRKNIEIICKKTDTDAHTIINEKSKDADLTMIGFLDEVVKHHGASIFEGYDDLGNILFVNAGETKNIS